ncbi:hypothetical protein ACLMJV_31740 [Sinorhizobium meliloti]|uniref:hypothetical protein n=1 Tax=Rhizobium meliloti TaxID=382 RepID=UPI00398CD0C5
MQAQLQGLLRASSTNRRTPTTLRAIHYGIENPSGSRYADVLGGNGYANILNGGDGNDMLIGGIGSDNLLGGNGIDTASYANAPSAVVANLSGSSVNTNDAAGDIYSLIDNIVGTNYGDEVAGNSTANALSGGGGDDVMAGNAGNILSMERPGR